MKISIDDFWEMVAQDAWTGYIWRVSSKNPEIFENTTIKKPQAEKYNLVQEANLFCKVTNKGLHVKQIDGEEMVYLYEMEQYENDMCLKLDKKPFVVPSTKVKVKGKKDMPEKLLFRNLYQLTPSMVSNEMESWIQVAQIFVGFKN